VDEAKQVEPHLANCRRRLKEELRKLEKLQREEDRKSCQNMIRALEHIVSHLVRISEPQ
jgi:hypothetical protein